MSQRQSQSTRAPEWTPAEHQTHPKITIQSVICDDDADGAVYFYDSATPVDAGSKEWIQADVTDLVELGATQ